jgi:FKBP-type peptidyl-prolyl cis-trans isomerase
MKQRRYLTGALGAFALLSLCGCDEECKQAEAATPAAAPQEAPKPALSEADAAAMHALGMMTATRMRLDVGFTPEEVDMIVQGLRDAAAGAQFPDNYMESMRRAEEIFQGHQNAQNEVRQIEADKNAQLAQAFIDALPDKDSLQKTESGLYYRITFPGSDVKATRNDRVRINYVGTLIDGTEFDRSTEPVELPVAGVVPGFAEGLMLVGQGGKITLYIPGALAYGTNPPPGSKIQPGSMLVFDVELLEIKAQAPRRMPPGTPPTMRPPSPPPNVKPPAPPTGTPPTPPPSQAPETPPPTGVTPPPLP